MPAATPIYGLPYQELGDPPDGPDLGQDLAVAVETELDRIDGLVGALADTDWIAMTDPGGDWDVSGGRYRRLNGVAYVVGGWTRVTGANPTGPTLFTLPAGFRPSDTIPFVTRHGSAATTTGIITAGGAITLDSYIVSAGATIRFAVAYPADA